MKAMIFAAGTGSRLKDLTVDKPKALIELNGITLLEHSLVRLKNLGIAEVVINVHHFADQIITFLTGNNNFGLSVHISDESNLLLDTGGGLKKAAAFLRGTEPVLIQNVDIIANLDFQAFFESHKNNQALATLAVARRESSRYLIFNEQQKLCGWENRGTNEKIMIHPNELSYEHLAFSGIHLVSPHLFDLMPNAEVFSIIDLYLDLAGKEMIQAFEHSDTGWFDVGTQANLEKAQNYLKQSH